MAASREQLLQSAEKNVVRGKLDQALRDYVRVLDDNPKDISTLNKVGDLYVRMNRPADSIPFFARIADHYSHDGFFLKAIAIYKKINKINPARLDVYERLADLYHKQGLTQDARSQYQVLADHYQKSNRAEEAIATYKKMAAVDPNDLRIQARLADLFRASKQIDQAVMQYGLIGSMLLRRGAHDEAAAVFQKALELSPNDAAIQKNLVRSLLAQGNPGAAIAILKAAPRTADSLALLAEAQLELGHGGDAARSAEQAIALDARHEAARVLLCRARVAEGSFNQALHAVLPVTDAAIAARDFARAAGFLAPVLEAEPAHHASLQKLAEIREAEDKPADSARIRLDLAREDERRGDLASAVANYQRVVAAVPGQPEALARLGALAPSAPIPAPAPLAVPPLPSEAPESFGDLEEPAASALEPLPSPAPGIEAVVKPPRSAEEQEIETLVVEAEVFAKYGLTDKAVERLRAIVRRRPDLIRARERLVELMGESQNPALKQETDALAHLYREQGKGEQAEALLARFGPPAPAAPVPPESPPAAPAEEVEAQFEEFEIEPSAPAPASEFVEDFGVETVRFSESEAGRTSPTAESGETLSPHLSTPEPMVPVDSEFVSYEELGSLLEDEMQKAGETPPSPPSSPPQVVDEGNLFADEQQFFNLAEELEKELADELPAAVAPAMASAEGEVSLEEIFREFKKGVEQQLSAEDYETHFNLGIAYKEMGLIDEAIGEFQLASKDPGRSVECCSMLGLCFLEKGMPQLAIKWYRKGLESLDVKEMETIGLLYDLACVYQTTGELDLAYKTFLEVYGLNANYREVVHRVKDLEAVKKN